MSSPMKLLREAGKPGVNNRLVKPLGCVPQGSGQVFHLQVRQTLRLLTLHAMRSSGIVVVPLE